ncbi:MAG: translation initiation factor IF-6 [archaeon]|nr:translation initiation factor IF-6 [archaeon]
MMRYSRCGGNSNVGVFATVNESLAFVARNATCEFVDDVESTFCVEAVRTTVAGSFAIGMLMAMNENGAIVSGLAMDRELETIRKKIRIMSVDDKLNAVGNNILVNNKGAIVNPELEKAVVGQIQDVLGVECIKSTIADINTVGSVCRVTSKGAAVHPNATEEDIQLIKDVFKVNNVVRTTLNHGYGFIALCALVNSKGAIVGDETTPIEMGKFEDALDFY